MPEEVEDGDEAGVEDVAISRKFVDLNWPRRGDTLVSTLKDSVELSTVKPGTSFILAAGKEQKNVL